ncbi:hypothetical protein CO051_00980 [Candidatus Roizmanbacteria bacterium CG_4_9_14_0_2_um_filter_39_13]|uniref:tRNA-binding domain-containing protein n=2 Tax=Candidatus Roizmaniibacteriota TaxID=1752723 RepID=A0A2M8F3G7_9BACT|nr:MAG: hypothetical protein COY15_03350 [Candidatus Roizmanbacteria bacterium CG_4_10_14_0_2_um_filter_39_12]PJC33829.1 MAG: hypothetical protein CO051_00980 [Candidatus Roizmanbacteria bacterium CG_4_9_14_0_2_um_filter_39_13]PJE62157.1 MAG: hypothetical protein COU87_00810 [Candidatus Roizmanbacteria bacterium CG10_big_fil_rev_8_21_14_0_10_39_12]
MKDTITFADFIKLDMQVGEVLEAIKVEDSNKLLKLTVNMGKATGIRTILTGMQKWYTPEDFIHKKFIFLVNLEPKKMAGSESQGMLMAADTNGEPKLIEAPTNLPIGSTIR